MELQLTKGNNTKELDIYTEPGAVILVKALNDSMMV